MLESQAVRPGSQRRHVTRFVRRRRRRLAALVLLAGAGIAAWALRGLILPPRTAVEPPPAAAVLPVAETPLARPATPAATTVQTRTRADAGGDAPAEATRAVPSKQRQPSATPEDGPPAARSVATPAGGAAPGRRTPPEPPSDAGPAFPGGRARDDAVRPVPDPGDPLAARRQLSNSLAEPGLDPREAERLREAGAELSRRLVFSPEVVSGDPFSYAHIVEPLEQLGVIARREGLLVDWRFIMRVNQIPDERQLRPGQRLKLVTGPFHAVVVKRDYRMDLYLGEGSQRVYVTSFPVGLGEFNSTPTGQFRVRENSKMVNPHWTNPRTGESYGANDPRNPLGERWIGLEGIDEHTQSLPGYGIHGTIEPETIGKDASMGCVRMLPDDVEVVYEVLVETYSTVEIR